MPRALNSKKPQKIDVKVLGLMVLLTVAVGFTVLSAFASRGQ